jgi:pimeloyl-ACP methyl ester carboxylesterase
VLTGTVDRIVRGERQGNVLASLLRNARPIQIEGAGHMLHHSHPDDVIRAVQGAAAAA